MTTGSKFKSHCSLFCLGYQEGQWVATSLLTLDAITHMVDNGMVMDLVFTMHGIFKVVAFQSSTTWNDTFIFLYYRGMFGVHSFREKVSKRKKILGE